MVIDERVYDSILRTFPAVPPEAGCILGERDGVVCTFFFDEGMPQYDAVVYTPNVDQLNAQIAKWSREGISFCGLAHSHLQMQKSLSLHDTAYILEIMRSMPREIERLYFPLVFPGDTIVSFAALRHGKQIKIVPEGTIIQAKRR